MALTALERSSLYLSKSHAKTIDLSRPQMSSHCVAQYSMRRMCRGGFPTRVRGKYKPPALLLLCWTGLQWPHVCVPGSGRVCATCTVVRCTCTEHRAGSHISHVCRCATAAFNAMPPHPYTRALCTADCHKVKRLYTCTPYHTVPPKPIPSSLLKASPHTSPITQTIIKSSTLHLGKHALPRTPPPPPHTPPACGSAMTSPA